MRVLVKKPANMRSVSGLVRKRNFFLEEQEKRGCEWYVVLLSVTVVEKLKGKWCVSRCVVFSKEGDRSAGRRRVLGDLEFVLKHCYSL